MTRAAPAALPALNEDALREALQDAHVPSLLMSLVHLTGDATLLQRFKQPDYLMSLDGQGAIPPDQQAEIRHRAFTAFLHHRDGAVPAPLAPETIRAMMDYIAGVDIPERYVPFLLEELAIDGRVPLSEPAPIRPASGVAGGFRLLIIGAGMSGIVMAIQARRAGVDVTMIEKNPEFGGTWFENTYPGCRVDNPSHMYAFSFESAHAWPQFFSNREVLFRYFKDVAEKYRLREVTRFDSAVVRADYDDGASTWSVRVRDKAGREETLTADAVVSAVGQLNIPRLPDIPGRDSFAGEAFHSARWRDDVNLDGKRVAVIGTGASAFQFVPEIAPKVAALTVFQRSAPWMAPTPNYHHAVPAGKRWLLEHLPFYVAWYRFWLFWSLTDGSYASVQSDPAWDGPQNAVSAANDEMRAMLTQYVAAQVGGDSDLLDKLIPAYPPGGKRMLRDNGVWIEALKRPNVELVTERIEAITPTGVRTADGRETPADVIIYGTGFQASDFLASFQVYGRDGVELHQQWDGDARAYLGVAIPGFPNFFCMYGPNTNIVVNGSIIFFSECAATYIMGCLRLLLERGDHALEVRREVHDRFNAMIDEKNALMAWGAPQVTSWYKNAKGRVSQNWPLPLVDYWERTRAPAPDDFIVR